MVLANNPGLATARLYKLVTDGDHRARLLGTCFAYANPKYYLTAAHCIGDLAPEQLVIAGEERRWAGTARRIIYHDTADIAILEHGREDLPVDTPHYFRGAQRPQMGMDFFAFGYPELGLNEKVSPRVFHGIFQRFYEHTSHMRHRADPAAPQYQYRAGELSIPCPAGLSGGPVFRREDHNQVLALVTENNEVGTVLHAIERTEDEGQHFRTETNRIILYGTALTLFEISDWLSENIPRVDN